MPHRHMSGRLRPPVPDAGISVSLRTLVSGLGLTATETETLPDNSAQCS